MGLDDLIRILLFAAFFWPLLSGLFKKRQPSQQKNKRSAPKPATREPRQQPSAERPATQPNTSAAEARPRPASAPSTNFDKRLEEARKRVREAMETSDKPLKPGRANATVPTAQPGSDRELFKKPAQQTLLSQPRQSEAQRLESAPRTFEAPKKAGYSIAETSFGEKSDPLKVTRLRRNTTRKRAQRSRKQAPLLDMSKTSILRGFVWQQILSEPKAKQNRAKRAQSRRGQTHRRTP